MVDILWKCRLREIEARTVRIEELIDVASQVRDSFEMSTNSQTISIDNCVRNSYIKIFKCLGSKIFSLVIVSHAISYSKKYL